MTLFWFWAYNLAVNKKRRSVAATTSGLAQRKEPVMRYYATTLLALVSSHLPGAEDRKAISRRIATIAPPSLEDEQRMAVREAEALLKAGVR